MNNDKTPFEPSFWRPEASGPPPDEAPTELLGVPPSQRQDALSAALTTEQLAVLRIPARKARHIAQVAGVGAMLPDVVRDLQSPPLRTRRHVIIHGPSAQKAQVLMEHIPFQDLRRRWWGLKKPQTTHHEVAMRIMGRRLVALFAETDFQQYPAAEIQQTNPLGGLNGLTEDGTDLHSFQTTRLVEKVKDTHYSHSGVLKRLIRKVTSLRVS